MPSPGDVAEDEPLHQGEAQIMLGTDTAILKG